MNDKMFMSIFTWHFVKQDGKNLLNNFKDYEFDHGIKKRVLILVSKTIIDSEGVEMKL